MEKDEDTGRFTEEYSAAEILEFIGSQRGVVTTPEVRDFLGCEISTAHRRLNQLVADGKLSKRKTPSAILWFRECECE